MEDRIIDHQWKCIENSNYAISNRAEVKNNKTNRLLKISRTTYDYTCTITIKGKRTTFYPLRMVKLYFDKEEIDLPIATIYYKYK